MASEGSSLTKSTDACQSSTTASTADNSPSNEDSRPMLSTPTYRPPGYPDMGSVWTQPPQPLPGPQDHPFFRWVAEGAKKDPAIIATMSSRPTAAKITLQQPLSTSMMLATRSRTDCAFVPAPSVAMEPMTPDTSPRPVFTRASPSQRTPDLSSSPTEPSPSSARTSTPASTSKQPLHQEKDPAGQSQLLGEKTAREEEEQPACTSTYLRVVTNPETVDDSRKAAVVSGQIWRSGSKKEGWRRHQWSTEGSMDVG